MNYLVSLMDKEERAKQWRHFKASSFKAKYRIIERFIKKLKHNALLQTKAFIIREKLFKKFFQLLWYLTVVAFTGITIYYAVTHFNWISIAILVHFTTDYIEWFVKLIKTKLN